MAGFRTWALILLISVVSVSRGQDDIREPPRITEPIAPKPKYTNAGQDITLKCRAEGRPSPVYEWYLNGVILPEQSTNGISYNPTTGDLTIINMQIPKEGRYNCRAKNQFPNNMTAVAISSIIELRIARIEKWIKGEDKVFRNIQEGSYFEIPCGDSIPIYYGATAFKWYITDASEGQVELQLDDRLFMDKDGNLHFAYVKKEDERGDLFYACAMSNALEGNIRLGRKNKIEVDAVTPLNRVKPLKQYTSDPTQVLVNDDARLECFFSGYDPETTSNIPTVSWVDKAGQPITTNNRYTIEEDGRVLVLNSVQQTDEQTYTCKGADSQESVEATVFLNVTSAPIWNKGLQTQTAVQDQDAVFNCTASSAFGERAPSPPKWSKNGERLTKESANKTGNLVFIHNMTALIVKSVKKDRDIACFQCSVGNSVGEVSSDGCLNVILPIDIIVEPPAEQEIEKGDIVNLTVLATSDALYPVSYEWIFKNKTYEGPHAPPNVTYDPVTKMAYINTTNLSEKDLLNIEGLYRRFVFNQIQSRTVDVVVTLKEKPPVIIPTVAEAGFDYWIIGLIIGILIIIIVILIICCVICRRKMLEGDYPVDRKETAAGLDPQKELKDSGFSDLSRADYDLLPEKKQPSLDFDDIPMGDDESFGSDDYGDEATAFNEDGSFIGQYAKTKKGGPPAYHPAESNV